MDDTNRVRRILMTADTVGGVWTYALDLARGLGRENVEVVLATMGAPLSSEQWKQAAAVKNLEIFESRYKLEWMEDPWGDVERAGDWLLALENDINPDVVHLNGYAHGSLPWRAPHIVAGHSCVLSWWNAVRGGAAPAEWTRYRRMAAAGLQNAGFVVAPTRAMMAELDRYYGPLSATAVIANGRFSAPYHQRPKEPFVLAAGRVWDEAKNIGMLVGMRRALDWPVYVAGEQKHPDGRAAELGGVRALGMLAEGELASWYARAAVYCLPAKYEPFGLSIVEAALSGCALLIGDIPSLRETWQDAAVFVPPDDPRALEWHLRDLTSNREYTRALGLRAKIRASAFTVERMAQSYHALYSRVLENIPAEAFGD